LEVSVTRPAEDLPVSPFRSPRRARWPKLRPDVLAVVFVGGCVGGWVRYAVTSAWPTPDGHLPWATFAVNTAGAFVLTLVIVVAADIAPSRYLRPLVGTGFCGALTTFSSVVVSTDQLFAHHHAGIAGAYLLASSFGGLAAAALGLVLARSVAGSRPARQDRSPQ
jgi:CrcB protein